MSKPEDTSKRGQSSSTTPDYKNSLSDTASLQNIAPPPKSDEDAYFKWRLLTDFEFYAKYLLKISTKGTMIPLDLNRPGYQNTQKKISMLHDAMEKAGLPVRIIVLKARRQGASTLIQGRGFHRATQVPYQRVKVVAHDAESTEYIFGMGRLFYEELPKELRPMVRYSRRTELSFENPKDENRAENPGLRSRITVATAGSKEAGRAQEVSFLHLSEVAFYENAAQLSAGLLRTVDRIPGTAIYMESTANGAGGYFYDQYWAHKDGKEKLIADIMRAETVDEMTKLLKEYKGTIGFIPLFFPWHAFEPYQEPIRSGEERKHITSTLTEKERQLIKDFNLSLEQVKWRRITIDELAKDNKTGLSAEDFFAQEYPSTDREAFLVSGQPVFDLNQLTQMKPKRPLFTGRIINPTYRYKRDRQPSFIEHAYGELKIYQSPEKGRQYSLGGDVALGEKGEDFSCLQVVDKQTFEQCAEWWGKIDPDELGRIAVSLAQFYNNAFVGIENNAIGIATNIAIRDTFYPYVYTRKTYKRNIDVPVDEFGWNTNMQTKPLIIANMMSAIREGTTKFNSEQLIAECITFRRNERGHFEAQEGEHDDRVMAMAIALQLINEIPYATKHPSMDRILHEYDFRQTLESEERAWDEEYGEVVP